MGLALGLLAAAAVAEPPQPPSERLLSEELEDLREAGLDLVFTTGLVRPDMTVDREIEEREATARLVSVLAIHGLGVRIEAGGALVVVPASAEGEGLVRGLVRTEDGRPLSGATLVLAATSRTAVTDADGHFEVRRLGIDLVAVEVVADGFVPQRVVPVRVAPKGPGELELVLTPVPVVEAELVVTPSRFSLLGPEARGRIGLSNREILALPHLGDDFFRALSLLPAAAANDVSAQFNVRGGQRDETQILIDGQELFDAYHLKDYDSALSFVAPSTLERAELLAGGFPASYGDRMSGVLDMRTLTPTGSTRIRVGASILGAQLGGRGLFPQDRGSWLVELRRGSIDLVGQLLDGEDPSYWDGFAKAETPLGERQRLRANLLFSHDALALQQEVDGETKSYETRYQSSYGWLTHEAIVGEQGFLATAISWSSVDRDRRGVEDEEDARFSIRDERDSEVFDGRQTWSGGIGDRHALEGGWHWRQFDTEYDYTGSHALDHALAALRSDGGEGTSAFATDLRERHLALFVTDRIRLTPTFSLELGLRYDQHSQTDERHLAPRANLAWNVERVGTFRLAWGRFDQSQRPYELQVEDDEHSFSPVERAEHRVVGFERELSIGPRMGPLVVGLELYQRTVANPRPRFVNLFEPVNTFPEVEPDRVRLAPDRSAAEGLEVFLRGRLGSRGGWWIASTWASTEDRIEGVWTPRLFDQRHALTVDLDLLLGRRWRINAAWRYHGGWPTTTIELVPRVGEGEDDEEPEVELVPVLGPFNAERLPDYHRLDLRLSRRSHRGRLTVDVFVEVQNAYDRRNVAGFDLEVDDEAGGLVKTPESWAGIVPSAGVTFEF